MPTARHSHSMLVFETATSHLKTARKMSSVFVIGGIGSNMEYNNSIEQYDIDKGLWSTLNLKNAVLLNIVGAFACQLNEKEILIFGGYKYHINSETIYENDQKESVNVFIFYFSY